MEEQLKDEVDELDVESFRSELSVLMKKIEEIEENRMQALTAGNAIGEVQILRSRD
ncbi:MAG: hypothetical protein JSV49_05245 [Thermoplasmata archaeon]|nr:MAG: hypothetical protein JSV49_05245 [Thermoplasmata archaeon]